MKSEFADEKRDPHPTPSRDRFLSTLSGTVTAMREGMQKALDDAAACLDAFRQDPGTLAAMEAI
ncbi:MAG TPA: hypothetical protein VG820_12180, partial [Fimbriimonadaceae bacterium]|nr:hypothetical protein [Fimbriimonadaceae bacterium]